MEAERTAHTQFIQAFLQSSVKEEVQKVKFLQAVSSLCTAAREQGFLEELKLFCEQYQVVENIKALLEEEPMDHLHTAVLQEAMLTLTQMSKVENLSEDRKKSLLQACFKKVFLLPPNTARQGRNNILYFKTLDAMDMMLESLVLSSTGCGHVWTILQMLLPFTDTKHTAACERAVARIAKLTYLMVSSSSVQVWSLPGHDNSSSHNGIISNHFLGQLLGHLMVCCTSNIWKIHEEAVGALHHLLGFIQQQKRMMSPEDDPEHPQGGEERRVRIPSSLRLYSTRSIAKAFGEYLQPADKTVIILKAIEAMRDFCMCDKEQLISIVDVAMREPASWLTEVWTITRCIYDNLEHISAASAQRRLKSLLLSMAEQNLMEMIRSLKDLSPACDSAGRAMEVLLSNSSILVKLLRELGSKLQHQWSRCTFSFHTTEACIQLLALVVSSDVTPEDFAGLYNRRRFPWCQNAVLFLLTLRGLVTLSQSPDTARKILVLLPELREALQSANTDTRMEALLICRNVMGHLKKKASSTALQLAKDFIQHFDDVSSQVRELSICLFKEIIQMVDWKHKWQMQKVVRKSLVPLVLHMSDEIESVAEVSYGALCVAAKVLKWKQLRHHMWVMERWRPVECLLEHEPYRAEEYVLQSMAYLQHAQVTMRMAAVRFIGIAGMHLKDNRKDTRQEICNALYKSSKEDESQVSSLAVQTIDVLRTSWTRPRLGWTLLALCCCL